MARRSLFGDQNTTRRIAEADSVAVIGLGRFGRSLALELMAGGTEVLGIDTVDENVQSLNGQLTQVVRADPTKTEVLRQLSIDQFDRVVVAIGGDLESLDPHVVGAAVDGHARRSGRRPTPTSTP